MTVFGKPESGPVVRVLKRLSTLPPDAARALDSALERAEMSARSTGRRVNVLVTFDVGAQGEIEALELTARFEWQRSAPAGTT